MIYLIGFMGVGKTTVADLLEKKEGHSAVDLDKYIENKLQMTVADFFEKEGEDSFRRWETALLKELSTGKWNIISCGGGIVLNEDNVKYMRTNGTVVYLKADVKTLANRLREVETRPVLWKRMQAGETPEDAIFELLKKRGNLYEKAAHFVINTDEKSPEEIAREVSALVID